MSGQDQLTLFREHLERNNSSVNTVQTLVYRLRSYFTSGKTPEEYLERSGVAASTRNKDREALIKYYEFAVNKGFVTTNPALATVKWAEPKRLPKGIKPNEFFRILDEIVVNDFKTARAKALLEVGVSIGARRGDFSNITLDDINFSDRLIRVIGKGDKEAFQPLGPVAIASIQAWLPYRETVAKTNYLFVNINGGQLKPGTVYYIYKQYIGDITPHQFNRDTTAIMMIRNHAAIMDVQKYLRHSSIATTGIYLTVSQDDLLDAHSRTHPRG